jgi:hypothetical protein
MLASMHYINLAASPVSVLCVLFVINKTSILNLNLRIDLAVFTTKNRLFNNAVPGYSMSSNMQQWLYIVNGQ